MAQQLLDFTRKMMIQVITDHDLVTTHNAYCCTLADEYAARLGMETTPSPAPTELKTPDTFSASSTPKPPAQRKPQAVRLTNPDRPATDRQLYYILSLGRRVSINLISPMHREQLQTVRNGGDLTAQVAAELIEAMKAQIDERPRPASNRQIEFIHSLIQTREWSGTIDFENLTSAVASGLISDLKAAPRKAGAPKESKTSSKAEVGTPHPEEGFYFAEGTYYKVQAVQANPDRRYAKRWNADSEQWIYDGQRHFKLLTPESTLTAEQASLFGKRFGRCIVKHCELTNEHSIELGYGPTCAKNMGWPY